jgi:hypothetical protein
VPSANPATNKFGPILLGSQWQPMLYWTLFWDWALLQVKQIYDQTSTKQ